MLILFAVAGIVFVSGCTGSNSGDQSLTQSTANTTQTSQPAIQQSQQCPFECCIDGNYITKQCEYNEDCINNNCVKKVCPYQCCVTDIYQLKQCDQYYQCVNSNCVPADSDNDGLTDIQEIQYGTNINLADTDGDSLTDSVEVNIKKTDPLKSNTDGDRYDDGTDQNPLTPNTAIIQATKYNEQGNYNIINIGIIGVALAAAGLSCLVDSCTIGLPTVVTALTAAGALNFVIYTSSSDIVVSNTGTDYTTYVNFDIVYTIGNKELEKVPQNIGILYPGQQQTVQFTHDIKPSDIAGIMGEVWGLIVGQNQIIISIENVKYEKFP